MPLDSTNFVIPAETKPDVFSLEGLIAWLETKPADETYQVADSESCLMGQYTVAMGGFRNLRGDEPAYIVGAASMPTTDATHPLSKVAWAFGPSGGTTFGAALARARKLQAERG